MYNRTDLLYHVDYKRLMRRVRRFDVKMDRRVLSRGLKLDGTFTMAREPRSQKFLLATPLCLEVGDLESSILLFLYRKGYQLYRDFLATTSFFLMITSHSLTFDRNVRL